MVLHAELQANIAGAKVSVTRSPDPGAPVWLDIERGAVAVAVEWRNGMGFGVSSLPTDGYGDGPDEIYADLRQLVRRVVHLFAHSERTAPMSEGALSELREQLRVPQAEVAKRLGITQAAVSKLERRSDMSIQSLRNLVRALGGHLEIAVRFPDDRTVRITQFEDGTLERA